MKIAFLHTGNFFTSELLHEFRKALPHHEVVDWISSKEAPALDFELLLAMGNVGRQLLLDQPKLKLIQTAATGMRRSTSRNLPRARNPSQLSTRPRSLGACCEIEWNEF